VKRFLCYDLDLHSDDENNIYRVFSTFVTNLPSIINGFDLNLYRVSRLKYVELIILFRDRPNLTQFLHVAKIKFIDFLQNERARNWKRCTWHHIGISVRSVTITSSTFRCVM
jgi:hypothetical protein